MYPHPVVIRMVFHSVEYLFHLIFCDTINDMVMIFNNHANVDNFFGITSNNANQGLKNKINECCCHFSEYVYRQTIS